MKTTLIALIAVILGSTTYAQNDAAIGDRVWNFGDFTS